MNTPLCILSVKNPFLFANTKTSECQLTEYQLNNDVIMTSFCFVNKSRWQTTCPTVYFATRWSPCACCKSDSAVTCTQLTVQTLLTKTHGRQVARTWIRLTAIFGGRCCRTSVTWIRSRRTSRNWTQRLWRSGTSYRKTQSASRLRISGSVCELNADGGHFEHLL